MSHTRPLNLITLKEMLDAVEKVVVGKITGFLESNGYADRFDVPPLDNV